MATEKLPQWDLSDLYRGLTDPAIKQDRERLDKTSINFAKTYRQTIDGRTPALTIRKILVEYEQIVRDTHKLQAYARLLFSTHSNSQKHGAFLQSITNWSTELFTRILFVELELSTLPRHKLQSLINDKQLQDFRHYLRRQQSWQPYRLTEAQEELLHIKSLTGRQAFIRLFEQEASSRTYTLRTKKTSRRLSETALLSLVYDPRRDVRKAAIEAHSEGLREESRVSTFIINTLIQDLAQDVARRSFERPEDMRHLENEVDHLVVDLVAHLTQEQYPVVQEYYRIKRKILGLPRLHEYDRYAPVISKPKRYTYNEAKEIILDAFHSFSPQFAEVAQKFFDNGWIDAEPRQGKQGGAYCMYVTPDVHPYLLVNFNGTPDSIMTMAHELGHGINAYLARQQRYLHFDWPLTIAETASVFAETILFNRLRSLPMTNQQKLVLYTHRIEGIFATVFRQMAMFNFERLIHEHHKTKGELTTEELNHYWRSTQEEMFGSSVKLTKNEDIRWSHIPHFIHTPFYVYAYSFGELLSLSLYGLYEENPQNFVPTYLDFLRAGGSASPAELLQLFSVDMHDQAFWRRGLREITQLVEQVAELAKAT